MEPRTTLLEVLRYQLDLTGAKPVSTDGEQRREHGARRRQADDGLHDAGTDRRSARRSKRSKAWGAISPTKCAAAFVEHDAPQCGFCTPGFVDRRASLS